MTANELNSEGRKQVEAELLRRGAASVSPSPRETRKAYLLASNASQSRTVEIRVKTKQKGSWHATTDEAEPANRTPNSADANRYWVFVDFSGAPKYWIVPEWWIRNNIHDEHQKYLQKHGGHRAVNDISRHHAIEESRLERWQDQWEILDIFQPQQQVERGHPQRASPAPSEAPLEGAGRTPTATALFINGIYDEVLIEILAAQKARRGGASYLQPYKGQIIAVLSRGEPSLEKPIRLYISTTANLSQVCYTAEIVGWEDKRELTARRRDEINDHFRNFQPGEASLFEGAEEVGERAVNLITIQNLRRLDSLYSTSVLRKTSDGMPLQKRSRSGGWSEVYDIGDLLSLATETQEQTNSDLAAEVLASLSLSSDARTKRLAGAAKVPEKIQIISVGFRRNADVIVATLIRANGVCERCKGAAPFIRCSDGSPYLEVHHRIPLSQGGEDTVENAVALCPNCHREVHHGWNTGFAASG